MKLLRALFAAALVALAPIPAFAGSVPLLTGPQDPSQLNATLNQVILSGNAIWGLGTYNTATGTTTSTCSALRCTISVTGLTTAASTLSAAMTVTNTAVALTSQVLCQTNGYAGTGVPIVVNITPAAGSFAFNIQNVSTGAALNATVPVACIVFK